MMAAVDQSEQSASAAASDPAGWVAAHGDALFRFACLRLGRSELAEDAVQETLLAALAARGRFAGAASERTWLIGILRNKIVDQIRRLQRTRTEPLPTPEIEATFASGLWRHRPGPWQDPTVEQATAAEFRAVLAEAVAALPSPQREALCLSELDGLPASEVATLLDVSVNNVWTLVHRAKLRLRAVLEQRWFAGRVSH